MLSTESREFSAVTVAVKKAELGFRICSLNSFS